MAGNWPLEDSIVQFDVRTIRVALESDGVVASGAVDRVEDGHNRVGLADKNFVQIAQQDVDGVGLSPAKSAGIIIGHDIGAAVAVHVGNHKPIRSGYRVGLLRLERPVAVAQEHAESSTDRPARGTGGGDDQIWQSISIHVGDDGAP